MISRPERCETETSRISLDVSGGILRRFLSVLNVSPSLVFCGEE